MSIIVGVSRLTPTYFPASQEDNRFAQLVKESDYSLHTGVAAQAWERQRRVFKIDVSICEKCGGKAKVIASIEDQPIIDKILAHLIKRGALPPELLPATRASPDSDWFA